MEKPLFESDVKFVRDSALNSKHRLRVKYENVEQRGSLTRKVVYLKEERTPMTPQAGVETLVGNLAFMVGHQIGIEHKSAYSSMLRSGNPFDSFAALKASTDAAVDAFVKSQHESKSQNDVK